MRTPQEDLLVVEALVGYHTNRKGPKPNGPLGRGCSRKNWPGITGSKLRMNFGSEQKYQYLTKHPRSCFCGLSSVSKRLY